MIHHNDIDSDMEGVDVTYSPIEIDLKEELLLVEQELLGGLYTDWSEFKSLEEMMERFGISIDKE